MRVTCVSFTNHTMQPVTTIKQMRWSHTQTERAYNVPDMTNYILIRIYLYIHTYNYFTNKWCFKSCKKKIHMMTQIVFEIKFISYL